MESVSSTLDLDLSCFHSICEGILSRLRLGLKIAFSVKKDALEKIENKQTFEYIYICLICTYIYMSIPLQIHIATRNTSFYRLKTVRTTKISWTAFPPAPYSVDFLDGFYFVKYLQMYHWASLPVRGIVRLFGGYEDMCMNQAFYVQDLGCNTTCKNAKKMHGKCLKHAWSWPILLSQHLRRHCKSATFGPKNHFSAK